MRQITIAGTGRTADVRLQGFAINEQLTHQENTCQLTLKSGAKPIEGQELIVLDSLARKFAGIIDEVRADEQNTYSWYKCRARDYTYQLNKLLVTEVIIDMAADDAVKLIIAKYCPGFTVNNVQAGAPVIDRLPIENILPSEALKLICEYVGWSWQVDYHKDIHFFNPEELADLAPITLNASSQIRNLAHTVDTTGLRNRIKVWGGNMLSDPIPVRWVADGVARQWSLPFKPSDNHLTVGEVPVTLGPEFGDNPQNFDYLLNYQEQYIKAANHTPTPPEGTTMELIARQTTPVNTVVEDKVSQAAVAVIQGGDGVYEHVISDSSIITLESALAAGLAELREHAPPRVRGAFDTEVSGWETGQILPIDLPLRGIEGTVVIQGVTITTVDTNTWSYRVEYGGRLKRIPDFMRTLLSAQQKAALAGTVVNKFEFATTPIAVSCGILRIERAAPWVLGDPDAYMDFMQFS